MKNYKNIAYTVIALSLMSFFAASQILAEGYKRSENDRIMPKTNAPVFTMKTNISDYTNGENTGAQVASENQSCPVPGVRSNQEANIARDQYVDSHMYAGLSNDFVNGFWKGYERTRSEAFNDCM